MDILQIILNILIITTIIHVVLDVWKWGERFKYWLFYKVHNKSVKYKHYNVKPFDCSFCLSYWLPLLYMILSIDIINLSTITLPFIGMFFNLILNKR